MYAIRESGQTVQYTENVDYCYRLRSGSPQVTRDMMKATAVFATPNVYNLEGFDDFDAPQVTVEQIDGAATLNELEGDLEQAYELLYGGESE